MNGNLFANPASDSADWLTAHCDGGSRGNPGPAGYGAVIEDPQGRTVAELSEFLGIQTNNFAEYSGLLAVLKWAVQNGTTHLRVVSDSELMVKQMQGKYAVKSPVLKPLFDEAKKLARRIEKFEMRHTLRGGNKVADRLANEAMDRGMGRASSQPASKPANQPINRVPQVPILGPGKPQSPAMPGAPGPDSGTWESTDASSRVPQVPPLGPGKAAPPKPDRQILEGYVKDGVVHLLGGELPDGVFVKIIRE